MTQQFHSGHFPTDILTHKSSKTEGEEDLHQNSLQYYLLKKNYNCPHVHQWETDYTNYSRAILCSTIRPLKEDLYVLPFKTWMDLEGIILSEMSQTDKEKTV